MPSIIRPWGDDLLDGGISSGLVYLHPCNRTTVHCRKNGTRGTSIKRPAFSSPDGLLCAHPSSHPPPVKSVCHPANMIAKGLPIALLAGAASAACPLSIEITDSDSHVVNVAVTNTGSETISVFKGNTVFSDHATKDLLVADAGEYYLDRCTEARPNEGPRTLSDRRRWQRTPIRGHVRQLQENRPHPQLIPADRGRADCHGPGQRSQELQTRRRVPGQGHRHSGFPLCAGQ